MPFLLCLCFRGHFLSFFLLSPCYSRQIPCSKGYFVLIFYSYIIPLLIILLLLDTNSVFELINSLQFLFLLQSTIFFSSPVFFPKSSQRHYGTTHVSSLRSPIYPRFLLISQLINTEFNFVCSPFLSAFFRYNKLFHGSR